MRLINRSMLVVLSLLTAPLPAANAAGPDGETWAWRPGARIAAVTGADLFVSKGCGGCHTIGQGVRLGPDLKGVTQRRDTGWLKKWLQDPTGMLAKDPIAQKMKKDGGFAADMPTLPLTAQEIDLLVAYMRDAK